LDNPERFADGGNAAPADNIPPCLAQIFNKSITIGKCATGAGCHSPNALGLGGDLDLTSPGVPSRLINVNATHAGIDMDGGGVTCPTAKLIDTANPMASWLLVKINGMQGSCGSSMPQVGTITSTQKACITQYVMDVAADAGAGMAMGGSGGMSSGGSAGTGGTPGGGSGGAATAGNGGAATAGNGGAAGSGGSGGASGGASGSAGTGGT
jgi:hypothetical protein